jgi:hypothetical protein
VTIFLQSAPFEQNLSKIALWGTCFLEYLFGESCLAINTCFFGSQSQTAVFLPLALPPVAD